jgi:uncharacterized protein (TIGR03437 family)
LAISATTTSANPLLYVPNFNSGKIEVYDTNYKPATLSGNFTDPAVPAGYAPWNIWNLGGKLYVMYAKQNAAKNFAVTGPGNGYVSIFDLNGNLLKHLASNGPLNAPWGVAIAPATFGAFANDILVGNFGDGVINAFDPSTGAALGALQDQNGNTIAYPGLWGLLQGNGGNGGDPNAIYFVTGYASQKHGLLGSIQAAPTINSVSNAADIQTGISPNSYISIYGANLSPVTRNWDLGDFSGNNLPRSLSGVGVTVNGKPAYVYYVSPKQIDVLTPVDTATGSVNVVVTNNGLVSNTASVTEGAFSPAFFLFKDGKSIAAIHPGGGVVGATTLYAGISTPAHANETIALFGTGFGTTTPNFTDGQVVPAPLQCATTPTVSFGAAPAQVAYCGLVGSGLYQVNVVVPPGAAPGDNVVTITFSGSTSNSNAMINVQ